MRRYFPIIARAISLLVVVLGLDACGGGGGGSGAPATAQLLAIYRYSPQAVHVSSTSVAFSGQISFVDPNGDIASATLTIMNSSGATITYYDYAGPGGARHDQRNASGFGVGSSAGCGQL